MTLRAKLATWHLGGAESLLPHLATAQAFIYRPPVVGRHSDLALTRLRGHHRKGGYDVPHGQERRTPRAARNCFDNAVMES